MTTFIDIHLLQLVPPSNINRDDTGSPKSARFGGVQRHRVSSQAWKRAVRQDFETLLDASELGERTKHAMMKVAARVQELRPEIDEEQSKDFSARVFKAAAINIDKKKPEQTGALMFISRQEIERLAELALRFADGEEPSKKEARSALIGNTAIDIALFGRMLADAPEHNVDAACQVEHALSVHKATQEFDYYTAIDDNAPEDNAGAGMIGTTEFVSSTLYRYATINVDKLSSNLGSADATARAVEAFVRAFVTSMPTGKQNSFANRTRPDFILVEVRNDQPVTFVNAFEDPIRNDGTALENAAIAMVDYAVDGDEKYGTEPTSSFHLASSRIRSDALGELLNDRKSEALNLTKIAEQAGAAAGSSE